MNLSRFVPKFDLTSDDSASIQVVLRIVLGIIVLYRAVLDEMTSRCVPDLVNGAWGGLLQPELFIGLGMLVVLGIADRWAFAILAVTYAAYNLGTKQMNLGPLVMIPLFVLGAVNAAAPRYSVSEAICPRLPRGLRGWRFPLALSDTNLSILLAWVFFCYALNSLCAVVLHLQDESWLRGETVWKIFTNNYLSRHFTFFRDIESRLGLTIPLLVSALAIIVQTIFQLFMWPLACARPGSWARWFVILQGFGFFTVSWVFMQLSVLPLVELLTWIVLFWSELKPFVRRSSRIANSQSKAGQTLFGERAFVYLTGGFAAIAIFCLVDTGFRLSQRLPPQSRLSKVTATLRTGLMHAGIWPPDVLNKTDLKMGEAYFVLYEDRLGAMTRVPVFHEDGARDWYHISDLCYFGMTLPWRRSSVAVDDWNPIPKSLVTLITKTARFHVGYSGGGDETRRFHFKILRDQSMDLRLLPAERYRAIEVCQGDFEIPPMTARRPEQTFSRVGNAAR
jgi:hypothetical protein